MGINLPENIVDTMMAWTDFVPEESTMSMQKDIMEGRPSELDFQVGSVVKLREELGIDVPVNRFIYHSLL